MGSLLSKNKKFKYLLCAIDVYIKYAWVKPLKVKKGKTVLNAIVADIIKIIVRFIKQILKDSKKAKRIRNYVLKCNLHLYFFI